MTWKRWILVVSMVLSGACSAATPEDEANGDAAPPQASEASPGSEGEANDPTGPAAAEAAPDTEAESQGDDGETTGSPITEFLGIDLSGSDEAKARRQERQRRAEELVAVCMAAQGFEYVPVDLSSVVVAGDGSAEEGWGTRDWAEDWGFGITTRALPQSVVGPGLRGFDDSAHRQVDSAAADDPNNAIYASLSEADRVAWEAALWGVPESDGGNNGNGSDDGDDQVGDAAAGPPGRLAGGCREEANREVSGGMSVNDFLAEFGDEFAEITQRVASDPRIVAAERDLAACVSDRGLTYLTDEELATRWENELVAIRSGSTPDASEVEGSEGLTDAEYDALVGDEQPLSDGAKVRLGELQAEEIELALATFECGGGPDDFGALETEVRFEYEQAFLDDNAGRLAALRPGS